MADPCTHPNFAADVRVARIGEDDPEAEGGMPRAFVAELTVRCDACGVPFEFAGVPGGLSFDAPRVTLGAQTLNAPIRPAGSPEGPSGLPGLDVAVHVDPPPASTRKPGCFHPWPGCNC